MGYESKLYIVDKTGVLIESDGLQWAEVIATFNICNVPNISNVCRCYNPTDCYIYEGEERITEDKYGDKLREIPIAEMIEILEQEQGTNYRRIKPCLQLLKGFDESQWNSLVVLHYGY